MVKILNNVSELKKEIERDKLNVIDFWAEWCGPCVRIAPDYEKLSVEYKNVNFFKVNVDSAKDIVELFNIKCMPTFIFIKNNKYLERVEGADLNNLIKIIDDNTDSI